MAWPVDKADGDVLTAAHVNAIKNSVVTWQGQVDANSNALANFSTLRSALPTLGGALGSAIEPMRLEAMSPVNRDSLTMFLAKEAAAGDWTGANWHIRRILDNSYVVGEIIFGPGSVEFSNSNGTISMQMIGTNIVTPNLRSTNPGAGTKQLWYDPADGNRVKFAV